MCLIETDFAKTKALLLFVHQLQTMSSRSNSDSSGETAGAALPTASSSKSAIILSIEEDGRNGSLFTECCVVPPLELCAADPADAVSAAPLPPGTAASASAVKERESLNPSSSLTRRTPMSFDSSLSPCGASGGRSVSGLAPSDRVVAAAAAAADPGSTVYIGGSSGCDGEARVTVPHTASAPVVASCAGRSASEATPVSDSPWTLPSSAIASWYAGAIPASSIKVLRPSRVSIAPVCGSRSRGASAHGWP